jgi:Skp family chaperone for outer membrane proteins
MRGAVLAVLLSLPIGAGAQTDSSADPPAAALRSPLLVIEPDRLFAESAFGKASAARIDAAQAALLAENRTFEVALEAEERDLTARRATLPANEFRALADAFDAKAEGIRTAQQDKGRVITESAQADRLRFLDLATPVLGQVMADAGAVAILDEDTLFLSFGAINVTDRAIVLIDQAIGDGSTAPPAP